MKITGNILFKQVVDLPEAVRHQALKNTNSLMVFTYFHLGRLIVKHEAANQLLNKQVSSFYSIS